MGGEIGCEAWASVAGTTLEGPSTERRDGNAFWVTLPAAALPFRATPFRPASSLQTLGVADDSAGSMAGEPLALADQAAAIGDVRWHRRPRSHILLTEDIVANQLVTATLLRREGHHVDIAESGRAAIDAIQSAPYDLVFMDIFMPGMSGQEATQIIRTLPEPACSTPIVALTAHIGAEDEARFKAVGMDGVACKPVSLPELLQVLDRYVWSSGVVAAPLAPSGPGAETLAKVRPTSGDPVPVLSAARINELRTNLPPETFTNLIEECLVDMDHRLPALRRALIAGAPAAVTAHAHALVGMAAGYGMAAVEARLRTIMAAARDSDIGSLGPTVILELEADFAEAAQTLRGMLRSEVV